jgi:hypothetical protein
VAVYPSQTPLFPAVSLFPGGDTPYDGERLPEWKVQIGFSSSLGRQITFDGTEFDDPFVGFGSGFTQFFDGPLDDVSAHVEEITITRGRDDLLGDMAAGQANLTLIDPPGQFGYFNPEDTSSPLAAESPGFQPMRPIKITAILAGVEIPVYEGFLRSAEYRRESPNVGRCSVTALDLFMWLSRVRPRDVEQFTGTLSGTVTAGGDAVTESDVVAVDSTGVSRSGVLSSRSAFIA